MNLGVLLYHLQHWVHLTVSIINVLIYTPAFLVELTSPPA